MSLHFLFGQLLQYGTTPLLVVLAFAIGVLLKKIDDNGKRDAERQAAMTKAFNDRMDSMETNLFKEIKEQEKKIEELRMKIAYVERDYLTREEHYKTNSGWKAETNRIFDAILNLGLKGGVKNDE